MKTKNVIFASLLSMAASYATAQQTVPSQRATITTEGDSIIIRKGSGNMRIRVYEEQPTDGESKEVEIYEGVYLERVESDKRTFLDALPFIPQKKKDNAYEPHNSGIFIGYSRMSNDFLSFDNSAKADLNLSRSWEFGFNVISLYHNFKKNPHWGLNFGVNWGYRSFSFDGNRALLKADGQTYFAEGDEENSYSSSRLRHFFFRIPITLEWQQRLGRSNKLFFNIGPEFEIRHGVKSFTHINGGKKQRMGKDMYVNPVGVNLLAQAGYGDFGLYLRYSTTSLFQKDKGPEISPYSFGIAWYW
jgi:hypothetical protein